MEDREPFENENLFKLDRWQKLLKSDEWREFKMILNARKLYREKQVLICVAAKNFDDAMRQQAKTEELSAIQRLAEGQPEQIEKEMEDANGSRGS